MTEGNYSNVGHRGPVYKGLGAMNPCDNQSINYRKCGLFLNLSSLTAENIHAKCKWNKNTKGRKLRNVYEILS
jgi:hypothetical protein